MSDAADIQDNNYPMRSRSCIVIGGRSARWCDIQTALIGPMAVVYVDCHGFHCPSGFRLRRVYALAYVLKAKLAARDRSRKFLIPTLVERDSSGVSAAARADSSHVASYPAAAR